MNLLVLSDLHLGKGKFLKNGEINILEDFFEDDLFYEFTEFYCTGEYELEEIHLVLNGDILNMIQIDDEGVFTHLVDEKISVRFVEKVVAGHKKFFEGLKYFLKAPNKKLTYVIGNHDSGMAFEKAQEKFCEIVDAKVEFCFEFNEYGVHIEHGHRFEAINSVSPKNYFVKGPNGKKILNLPWGSLFCISVLPKLKKDRPLIDKVRPMSNYIRWTLIHDFFFFCRMAVIVLKYLWKSNKDIYTKQNKNFKTSLAILKQITIYPKYGQKAKSILRRNKSLHTVIMGHTHVQEWRKFPGNRYYFNTGTWNPMPSMDAGMLLSAKKLAYCHLEINKETNRLLSGGINLWQGKWRPYREEVSNSLFSQSH